MTIIEEDVSVHYCDWCRRHLVRHCPKTMRALPPGSDDAPAIVVHDDVYHPDDFNGESRIN